MNKTPYRSEWKYLITDAERLQIEKNIEKILPFDSNYESGTSTVRSLYFDDINNSNLFDNNGGYSKRHKWRIRRYNDNLSYIILERKEKLNELGRKRKCVISVEQYNKIMNKEYHSLFWNTQEDVIKEFCIECLNKCCRPKVIIEYNRTAYVDAVTNTRVTFDSNISASGDLKRFLDGTYMKVPLFDIGQHIMEVKYDGVLQSYIKQAVHISNLQQTSYSKYCSGMFAIRRI